MSYESKCLDSFRTKLNIFLFTKCINGGLEGINVNEFNSYEINDKDIEVYVAVYHQLLVTETIKSLSITEIEQRMKTWERRETNLLEQMKDAYKARFPEILSRKRYDEVASGQECYYCKITLDKINELIDNRMIFKKSNRGFNMEIDRKSPNKEYSTGNVETCCYWCNNAKTDEFNEQEFRPIADGIRKAWAERLKKV